MHAEWVREKATLSVACTAKQHLHITVLHCLRGPLSIAGGGLVVSSSTQS